MIGEFKSMREKILELLLGSEEALSVEDICRSLGLSLKDEKLVYQHLTHLAKSVRRSFKGRRVLLMQPPYCRDCGYVFKSLERAKRPSKCPKCKSERIESPRFIIGEV